MQNIYLNTAATGLLPEAFVVKANELNKSFATGGSIHAEHWRENVLPEIRESVAAFVGTGKDNLAFLPNFSWGITGIVHSLRGDEKVLMYDKDYPSFTDAFKVNDFAITWVSDTDGFTIPMDELKSKLLSEQIDILAISHVQWMSGYKADLAELGAFCKEHDIWFIVDATQGMGALFIDVVAMNIDVLIASNYKWMNAGFGTAIMYASTAFLQEYTPKVAGFNSYVFVDGKPTYTPGIRSYEPGHPNMFGISVLNEAIKDKIARGVKNIEEHNRKLTQLLLDGIRDSGAELFGEDSTTNRASIVFLKDKPALWDKLKENNIIVSYRGNIRISMHYYNTEAEVQALVDVLRQL